MTKARQRLAGSERAPVEGSKCLGPADPAQTMHVIVTLRHQNQEALDQLMQRLAEGDRAEPLSREAFAARFGVADDDLAKLQAFAKEYELEIVRADAAACTILLKGTVEHFQTAFGVQLQSYEHPKLGQFRGRTGPLTVPDELAGVVTAVLGLDDRPQARAHFRYRAVASPESRQGEIFTPLQIASLYDFPPGDGAGQCIGIIELGGGYEDSDLHTYFAQLGVPAPTVVSVSVGHGSNSSTGNPSGPDNEVTLDIEIAGAVAPGATIVAYFAPNGDAGFIDAVSQAVHDTTHRPSVISISWGGPEPSWTPQAFSAFNQVLQAAAAQGVTVCVAAGDSGSGDGVDDGGDHVDFPASSPYVLACGGTRITAGGTAASGIESEVVWNDGVSGGATGGGISARFELPSWQAQLQLTRADGSSTPLTMRGVPDVAGNASPGSGYQVLVDGESLAVGGTSAVAPLFAGLIARLNAANGKPLGFLNAALYRAGTAFNDITRGNNGSYAAAPGWDACTGLGSPDGQKIAKALQTQGAG
ncbi:S53 family peptidase [Trinickia fusca]|uniref:Peptidase S53 n=1 Tax=Trinickia fusca TaxID=2419777 RepID=A0A494X6H5_9BURK|nr:S53 family peptidase [Trinickia fusca]RKP45912.1 peptidase S53 [Trinickia fusca]